MISDERGRVANGASHGGTKWYAAYTRSRCEKAVARRLGDRGVEHFLPVLSQVRQWKDRKRLVQMPLFPGYVFVSIDAREKLRVLNVEGVVRLVGEGDKPSPIPTEQIDAVRDLLKHPELVTAEPYVDEGTGVEIVAGPFRGVRGIVLERHGRRRVLVGVDLIRQAVSVEVDLKLIRRFEHAAA